MELGEDTRQGFFKQWVSYILFKYNSNSGGQR